MANKLPTEDELLQALTQLENELKLSDLERATIRGNPNYLPSDFQDKKHSLYLHHLGGILSAQVEKAQRGDTAAAKFLVELCAPGAYDSEAADKEPVAWETAAIQLRDTLGLDMSAEVLVLTLLSAPVDSLRELLSPGDKGTP